jgi:hypothetical protein
MVCRAPYLEGELVVLVSHHPISVFTAKAEHLDKLKKKPDGHYNREDLVALVNKGQAVLYDENAVAPSRRQPISSFTAARPWELDPRRQSICW